MDTSRFTVRNEPFTCVHCGMEVQPLSTGGCRNHCPECFYSLHLDINPGDRSSECQGVLAPIAVESHSKKGYMVVHRCLQCGHVIRNKLALEEPVQPDNLERMLELMKNPPSGV